MTLTLEVDRPDDLARFRLPEAVAARLQTLLDHQDSGKEKRVGTRLDNLSKRVPTLFCSLFVVAEGTEEGRLHGSVSHQRRVRP